MPRRGIALLYTVAVAHATSGLGCSLDRSGEMAPTAPGADAGVRADAPTASLDGGRFGADAAAILSDGEAPDRAVMRVDSGAPDACIARVEDCNGADDDCDSLIDESLSRACTTACGAGTETCAAGVWMCSGPAGSAEVCNGVDDDCDGLRDDMAGCPCEMRRTPDGHVYLFCTAAPAGYGASAVGCSAFGYHLATIETPEEQRWLVARAREIDSSDWWVGAPVGSCWELDTGTGDVTSAGCWQVNNQICEAP